MSQTAAHNGDALTLTGANWPANQTVEIIYCHTDDASMCLQNSSCATTFTSGCSSDLANYLTDTQTDSVGRFRLRLRVPNAMAPGSNIIMAQPVATPFPTGFSYNATVRLAVLYPFAQAHPRLMLAIHAAPYVGATLLIAAAGVWFWLRKRRATVSVANH
jgi:hypothetical protein